jgi:hypothetical protein
MEVRLRCFHADKVRRFAAYELANSEPLADSVIELWAIREIEGIERDYYPDKPGHERCYCWISATVGITGDWNRNAWIDRVTRYLSERIAVLV